MALGEALGTETGAVGVGDEKGAPTDAVGAGSRRLGPGEGNLTALFELVPRRGRDTRSFASIMQPAKTAAAASNDSSRMESAISIPRPPHQQGHLTQDFLPYLCRVV